MGLILYKIRNYFYSKILKMVTRECAIKIKKSVFLHYVSLNEKGSLKVKYAFKLPKY